MATKLFVASADDHYVRMRRVGTDRFVNTVQRATAACAAINQDGAGPVEIKLLPYFVNLVRRRGTETLANRHPYPLDTPRSYTFRGQTQQCFIRRNKVAVDERRCPSLPERWERIGDECV